MLYNESLLLLLSNTSWYDVYAHGLRDKGFEMLNALGCSSSIDHIRNHGSFWAKQHKSIDELDVKKPWRMTIDNLNFYMKII